MQAALAVPLLTRGKVIGGLMTANRVDRAAYQDSDREILTSLALNASAAIENARYVRKTELLAVTDSLTGLYNHREFRTGQFLKAGGAGGHSRDPEFRTLTLKKIGYKSRLRRTVIHK